MREFTIQSRCSSDRDATVVAWVLEELYQTGALGSQPSMGEVLAEVRALRADVARGRQEDPPLNRDRPEPSIEDLMRLPFLTRAEAARVLRCSPSKLDGLLREGAIPKIKAGSDGKRGVPVRIRTEALRRYMDGMENRGGRATEEFLARRRKKF